MPSAAITAQKAFVVAYSNAKQGAVTFLVSLILYMHGSAYVAIPWRELFILIYLKH